jgi:lycopene beta-cyclase
MSARCEIVVIGCGPAGRWVAMDLSRAGIDVRIVTPVAQAPLVNTFAVWTDHLAGLEVPMARTWSAVDVVCRKEHRVERAYSVVDLKALVARTDHVLTDRWIEGTVERVDSTQDGRVVVLSDGSAIHAKLVVDASGSARVTAKSETPLKDHAHQIALGEFVATRSHPERPMLMDFSGGLESDKPPSFGYILPVADDSLLVEETWLAVRPTRPTSELRDALAARRARWPSGAITETERVSIDLEVPLPPRTSHCVMLGAAAGQVHPATGYSFAASVVSASRLADFCVRHREHLSRDSFVSEAHQHVCSSAQQRTRALFAYGLDGMLRMDRKTIAAFFEAFFTLDQDDQSVYLNGLSDVKDVRRVMLRLFPSLTRAVQWALVAGSPLRLSRAFV